MQNFNYSNRAGGFSASNTWPGWLGVLGGLWLIIAPFILGYSNIQNPFFNDIIIGIIGIVLTGFCAITAGNPGTTQARLGAGGLAVLAEVWLIFAPFILNYSGISNALWNDIITGVLFIVVGAYGVSLNRSRSFTSA